MFAKIPKKYAQDHENKRTHGTIARCVAVVEECNPNWSGDCHKPIYGVDEMFDMPYS